MRRETVVEMPIKFWSISMRLQNHLAGKCVRAPDPASLAITKYLIGLIRKNPEEDG
jgi:hypothetical protein